MLIPQFSIRDLLIAMTGVAVFSLVVSYALRGQIWAIAVAAGVGSIAAAFVGYAATFLVVWCIAALLAHLRPADPPRPAEPPAGSAERAG
jgi:hypothetical protein